MKWIVEKELREAPGYVFMRQWLESFDLRRVEWVRLDFGREKTADRATNGVWGRCWYPARGRRSAYAISCQLGRRFPAVERIRMPPVYGVMVENPGGGRLADFIEAERQVPAGCVATEGCVSQDGQKCWLRVQRTIELATRDEGIVFIVAHEAFHFLRRTRQVPCVNNEIQADAFAVEKLEEWRRVSA